MKRLLLHQPGRFGDIIICLPIARFFSQEYEIHWWCPREYHPLFRNIDYCVPVEKPIGPYDRVVDLSFGIVTNSDLQKWWVKTRESWKSFVVAKYKIAHVPLLFRWKLVWNRDKNRENALYTRITNYCGSDYSLVHQRSAHRLSVSIPAENKVLFEPIEDYNIFDWFKVIMCAREIHCIDSSLANFVEVLKPLRKLPKYLYVQSEMPDWNISIYLNNWEKRQIGANNEVL